MKNPLPGRTGIRVATALAAAWLLACGPDPAATGPVQGGPPPSVTVSPVQRTQLVDERDRIGRVAAVDQVEIRARVSGFIEERAFAEGSVVEAGDLLFRIEPEPYEAELARAEAEAERARARAEETSRDLSRARDLERRAVVSQSALDKAVAAAAEARATLRGAEARVRQARLDLGYTEVRAPIRGRTSTAAFSVGDLVGPDSDALTTLVSIDPIHVYWQVPERVVLRARRQNVALQRQGEPTLQVTARLRLEDGSAYPHEGIWDFIDNRVDITTGTQTARAVFPNPDGLLVPGQYASVRVAVGEPRETLVIPQSAVQEDQAGRFVLVLTQEDEVELRRVEMGDRRGIFWEVVEGLSEGERVIYQGIQKVRPGVAVSPVVQAPDPPVDTAGP